MKQINFLLILVLFLSVFACQKNDEIKPSSNPGNPDSKTPEYNEDNSSLVDWQQLPEKLKNAKEYTTKNSNERTAASYLYAIGTWGGGGGGAFSMYPYYTSGDKIYAIGIRSGAYVDALIVWYITPGGSVYYWSAGGTGGAYYVQYFASNEYIYAIGGRSGAFLDRISIYTNYKSFSYGGNGGGAFYRSVGFGEQILGFFGGSGSFIDRIGGYVYSL